MNLDRRLLGLALRQRGFLALSILLGLAGGVLIVLQARLLSRVVDRVFLGGQGVGDVSAGLGWLLALILLRALLNWAGEAAGSEMAIRIKSALRRRLFDHIQALGPLPVRGERSGELSGVLQEGVESLDAYFSQYLPQIVLAALTPLIFLFFVFPMDWLSGLILLLTAPLIPLFMVLVGNMAQELTRRQWQSLSRMSAYFLDVLQGLTTLKMLGRSKAQTETISQTGERYRQVTMSVLRVTFLSALALEMISTLSTAVVAVQVGLRLLYGSLGFEQALFVLLLAPEFYLPLRMLGARFHAGMAGAAAAERIFSVLETPAPEPVQVDGRESQPGALAQGAGREISPDPLNEAGAEGNLPASLAEVVRSQPLVFHQVSLEYDGQPALSQVSFELPVGQVTALVGPSGGGKSSLASLLLRFVQPTSGEITLGEQPLNRIPADAWRSQIAWVPQLPFLFQGSVLDNIRLGCPQASLAQVIEAAHSASAHEFIETLPQGYETRIGERGARLSGGQAQRIALARAFLRNAPLVILDEATANLDPITEEALQRSLQRLLQGKTALIIAHRLNTIRSADQILVMKQGAVLESGKHEDLLAQDGLYARLVQAPETIPAEEVQPGRAHVRQGAQPGTLRATGSPENLAALDGTRRSLAVLLRLLRFVLPFSGLAALAVLAGFATVASSIGLMAASAYIISYAALAPSIAELQVAIVGVRFFGITRGLFRYLERYLSHQVTFRLLAHLRTWFYQALEPLAPARTQARHSGDLLARILGDIQSLENFYVRALAPPWTALLVSILALIILAGFDRSLALVLLVFFLLAGLFLPLVTILLARGPGAQMVAHRAELYVSYVDSLQGMADLAANNRQADQSRWVADQVQALSIAQRRFSLLSAIQATMAGLLTNLAMWSVLAAAIPLVAGGGLNGVYLAVVALTALTSFEALTPLPMAAQYWGANLGAAARLFEVVDTPAAGLDRVQASSANAKITRELPSCLDLQVKDLNFSYDGNVKDDPGSQVLHNISFDLPQGKHLAIAGPSGAGKSTLVNLLLRFWQAQPGQILLGGVALNELDEDQVRSKLAVISQSTYLFSASLRDNLRLARPAATQAEIEKAVQQAGLQEFVGGLPQGLETWIGEHGLRLSGGERQRLAIARALLKEAPILILDEATTNLDALTERQVLSAITNTWQGRSVLMITHRLSAIPAVDEILVMEQGRIVERGRHAALLAQAGLYRRMWHLQHNILQN